MIAITPTSTRFSSLNSGCGSAIRSLGSVTVMPVPCQEAAGRSGVGRRAGRKAACAWWALATGAVNNGGRGLPKEKTKA